MLFASLVSAQSKPGTTAYGPKQDSVQQMQEKDAAPMNPDGRQFFNGHRFHFRETMMPPMQPGCGGPGCSEMRGGSRCEGRPFFMHHNMMRHHPMMHRFFRLLMLMIVVVNILLTIIVSLDMVRMGRFNGLWLPVVLLVGIPGSMIYALFRIGDKIHAKENASAPAKT
jgi:hypothetical protein